MNTSNQLHVLQNTSSLFRGDLTHRIIKCRGTQNSTKGLVYVFPVFVLFQISKRPSSGTFCDFTPALAGIRVFFWSGSVCLLLIVFCCRCLSVFVCVSREASSSSASLSTEHFACRIAKWSAASPAWLVPFCQRTALLAPCLPGVHRHHPHKVGSVT